MTHDGDFGSLAIRTRQPYTGIIYLRPGYISPSFVLDVLRALSKLPLDVFPPFLVVAERREGVVRVRLRSPAEGNQTGANVK